MFKMLLNHITNKLHTLPVLVLMPHSRCNCRCVMCDIWKANDNKKEISVEELEKHVLRFKELGVRVVVFSGGEALMHSNLWRLCSILNTNKMNITLLSTGLLLERNASEVISNFKEVIVSLDGSQPVHDRIRNIPGGFQKLAAGVHKLIQLKPDFRITGRCVLQRHNFRDFIPTIKGAKDMGFSQISFLAADITTSAFNRPDHWGDERVSEVALNTQEAREFEDIIEQSFQKLEDEFDSKFIAESPEKMRKIVQYYKAINQLTEFPRTICNAPWVSAVIESDGSVMPCFFHKPYGNIHTSDFMDIINSSESISFRKNLNVETDPICKKCVCSLKLGLM